MRISWGTKIAFLYGGFVVMILALVSATFRHKNELVTEDYYQQETVFQKRLDAARAAQTLEEPLLLTGNSQTLILTFPVRFSGKEISGNVHFYAPSHAAADRSFPLTNLQDRKWIMSREKLATVPYEVQVSWAADGVDYYQTLQLP